MPRVIYKKTGQIDKGTKSFPAILFRSRERNRGILIGNSPVEVSKVEYEALKRSKHAKDIVIVTSRTKLSEPMKIDINAPKIIEKPQPEIKKEPEKKRKKVVKEGIETKDSLIERLKKFSKKQLDEWAEKRGIKLDRRKSLSSMLKDLVKQL